LNLTFERSAHAVERMAQRNLTCQNVEYVLRYGQKVRNAGAWLYFLGKKDIPGQDRSRDDITRLEGTGVICDDGEGPVDLKIITVVRNKNYLQKFCRKEKYDLRKI